MKRRQVSVACGILSMPTRRNKTCQHSWLASVAAFFSIYLKPLTLCLIALCYRRWPKLVSVVAYTSGLLATSVTGDKELCSMGPPPASWM